MDQQQRFIDNGDGTITDIATKLMWQNNPEPFKCTWHEAFKYCKNLEYAGHKDWRLPSVQEFQSIMNYDRFDPITDPIFNCVSDWYWSSTTYAGSTINAWAINFYNGGVFDSYIGENYIYCIRAVRNV